VVHGLIFAIQLLGDMIATGAFVDYGSFMNFILWYLVISVVLLIVLLIWCNFKNWSVSNRSFPKSGLKKSCEVFILSEKDSDSSNEIQNFAKRLSYPYNLIISIDQIFGYERSKELSGDFLFIDMDHLERSGCSVGYIIDIIRSFRLRYPECAVILLSSEFGRDDYDMHRLEVCDASLSLPVSQSRILEAALNASSNNLVWCKRWNELYR